MIRIEVPVPRVPDAHGRLPMRMVLYNALRSIAYCSHSPPFERDPTDRFVTRSSYSGSRDQRDKPVLFSELSRSKAETRLSNYHDRSLPAEGVRCCRCWVCLRTMSRRLSPDETRSGGPAGLMASLCLTTYGFNILHIDERSHPTTAGRADGIQPRTIEVRSCPRLHL
jgi:hypothetical protein